MHTDKHQGTDNPILILVRGLPGSGKSYLAEAIKEKIGKDKVVTVDPDVTDHTSKEYLELSRTLTTEGVDAKFHPYRFLRAQAHAAIAAHKIIIWNQAFTNLDGFNKTIINLQAYAEEHNTQLPVLVVEVEVTENVARARVADREGRGGHGVTGEAFARFINEYVTFAGKGYNIVVVNGENNVDKSAALVIEALQTLN
jgi:thymidylate kinase